MWYAQKIYSAIGHNAWWEKAPLYLNLCLVYLSDGASYQNSGIVMEEGSDRPQHTTVDVNEAGTLDSTVLASKPVEPTSWEQIKAVIRIQFLLIIRMPLVSYSGGGNLCEFYHAKSSSILITVLFVINAPSVIKD